MKRFQQLAIGIAIGVMFAVIGVSAAWLVAQHFDVGGGEVNTAHPYVANLDVSQTDYIWPALLDAEPGDSSFGGLTVSNGNSPDDVLYSATVTNTNDALAEQIDITVYNGDLDLLYDGNLADVTFGELLAGGADTDLTMTVTVPLDLDPAFGDMENFTTFHFTGTPQP